MTTLDTTHLWMLHLGLGSFHRAHQAVYLNSLHKAGDTRWAIAGGNIRPDMAQTIADLQAQDGSYTLETVTPQGVYNYERITAIERVVSYNDDLVGLIDIAKNAATRIISFTVTEAGYYLDANDQLDLSFCDLTADIEAVKAGRAGHTIYGALCTLLRARMVALNTAEAGVTLYLGYQKRFRVRMIEAGGMKLYEFHVRHRTPCAPPDGHTVSSSRIRVRRK